MNAEKNDMPIEELDRQISLLGRRGLIASVLAGAATLAVKSFSWLHFSPADYGEYRVIADWQIPAEGKGMIIAISPHYGREELRTLASLLRKRFAGLDNAVVMIFDDANAARQVRRGSRIIVEKQFQAALMHQRAMYLKSSPREEDSFTIYKKYPAVDEVIRFDESDFREAIG